MTCDRNPSLRRRPIAGEGRHGRGSIGLPTAIDGEAVQRRGSGGFVLLGTARPRLHGGEKGSNRRPRAGRPGQQQSRRDEAPLRLPAADAHHGVRVRHGERGLGVDRPTNAAHAPQPAPTLAEGKNVDERCAFRSATSQRAATPHPRKRRRWGHQGVQRSGLAPQLERWVGVKPPPLRSLRSCVKGGAEGDFAGEAKTQAAPRGGARWIERRLELDEGGDAPSVIGKA